jgi:hypothetical protein
MLYLKRWFVAGGNSWTHLVVAFEEIKPQIPAYSIHVKAFSGSSGNWISSGEWILPSRPHAISDLLELLYAPEVKSLTEEWELRQRWIEDVTRRQAEANLHRAKGLRELNISDEEVREIQAVVSRIHPGAIVMISGVAKGCPCEDGPNCSAQVSIAVHRPELTTFLELSDINEHWSVGPVQQWYLDSERLARSTFPSLTVRNDAQRALNDRYPTCRN